MSQARFGRPCGGFIALVLRLVFLASVLLAPASVAAADVALSWNAVTSPPVAGYTVHWGTTSGSYVSQVDAGNVTSTTLTGLTEGTTYFYAVRAYDAAGNRSGYSTEVTGTVAPAAPVAVFSAVATSGTAPFAVDFRGASTGTITSHAWNFGDGTSSTAANPSKTYAAAGVYTVSLTVTGPVGSHTATRSNYITVTADTSAPSAPGSFVATASGATAVNLAWAPAADNVAVSGYGVQRCTGSSCTSFAQIGAPTGTTYTDSGRTPGTTYRYRVRAVDAAGNLGAFSSIASVTTTAAAPVASFTATPVSGAAPLAVTFASTSAGSISSYAWTFGDGTTSSTANPTKVYASAGTFSVSLTVTGPGGSHTATRTNYIGVTGPSATLAHVNLHVDAARTPGTVSNANGILEPGETVLLAPVWQMTAGSPVTVTATARIGDTSGAIVLGDASAAYGTLSVGSIADCRSTSGNCYLLTVSASARRPSLKWGVTLTETLSTGQVATRTIPIGKSFKDVAPSDSFYPMIESLAWNGVTVGYADGTFQPTLGITRWQTGVFLARATKVEEQSPTFPASGMVGTTAYSCVQGGRSLFADIPPTDPGCAQLHHLAAVGTNVSFECGGAGLACPTAPTTRVAMAVLVAGTMAGGGDRGVPLSATFSDTGAARSYNCNVTGGSRFSDVSSTDTFCRHVNYLWARGVVDGFTDGTYGPHFGLTRGQMAKIVSNAFQLRVE